MTMLFLAWLAVSFLVVAVINLYLRRFGLPRGQATSASTVFGKVSSTSSVLSHYSTLSTGIGLASSTGHGESAHWINSIVTWIYQRASSSGHRAELLDTWLKSLTEQAEHQSREVRVKFDDVHGSPPEFSNFSVDPTSAVGGLTGATSSGLFLTYDLIVLNTTFKLNVYMTTTAKDITLQVCILIQNVDSTRTIYADVYILHLQGQLKVAVSPTTANGETPVQVSFVSTPELRLQILPSGRLNTSTDLSSVEAIVRAALGGAVAKFTWLSSGGIRSVQPPNPRTQQQSVHTAVTPVGQPANQQSAYGTTSQQGFTGSQSPAGYGDVQILSNVSQQQFSLPLSSQQPQLQQHLQHQQLQQQQHQQQQQQQQQQQFIQQQQYFPQQQSVQLASMSPSSVTTPRIGDLQGRSVDVSLQDSFNSRTAERLLVKVIKANGLADDLGNCNAYCVVRVDRPAQNFMTGVIRNTVNPMWDEQFVLDTDSFTRQIQFDILDREKQPDNELLGKAVVQFDEIRRIPSSRQILPLTGRLRSRTATSGSVTVEFVFMDATELSRVLLNDNVSSVRGTSQQALQSPSTGIGNVPLNDQIMKPNINAGDYAAFQNRLSAHDLALSQQGGSRQQESPTLVVTGTELQRSNVAGTLDGRGRGHEPKESFASALKKRLTRGGKKRSQSADRAKLHSQSLHEGGSYLRPPGDSSYGYRTTDMVTDDAAERKARSNSFTSSLRRIFKPSQGGKKDISREGSLTRSDPSAQYQSQLGYSYDRSIRQSTPVPPGADRRGQDQYSNTPSATATLPAGADRRGQDHYGNTLSATATVNVGRY